MSFLPTKRKLKRLWRKRAPWVNRNAIALLVALLSMSLFSSPVADRFEPLLLDLWSGVRGVSERPEETVIISIDEESYSNLGISLLEAWPRSKHVELLRKLRQANPKLVVFDLFFRMAGSDRETDQEFAQALKSLPTYIGKYEVVRTTGDSFVVDELGPQEMFEEAAKRVVMMQSHLDHGVLRRFPIGSITKPHRSPAFVRALRDDFIPGAPVPGPRDFIRFYGPAGSLQTVPYSRALSATREDLRGLVEGKIVFVGILTRAEAGITKKDSFMVSSVGLPMFGVEVHATSATNVLRSDWIRRLPLEIEKGILAVSTFVLTLSILLVRPHYAAALVVASIAGWSVASYVAFLNGYFLPGLFLTLVVLPTVLVISTLYYYLLFQRSHKQMETALGVHLHVEEK